MLFRNTFFLYIFIIIIRIVFLLSQTILCASCLVLLWMYACSLLCTYIHCNGKKRTHFCSRYVFTKTISFHHEEWVENCEHFYTSWGEVVSSYEDTTVFCVVGYAFEMKVRVSCSFSSYEATSERHYFHSICDVENAVVAQKYLCSSSF